MAFVDDPNSQSDQQVAGASPLSTGQDSSAPMVEGSQNTAPTGSTIQSQAPESSSAPQGSTINKKAPKASSGMFTNIQKYVDKNKPQAQKIAGAVTQDVGKQAEQIRQAAQEKQQQQQQTLQANQNLIQQNQDWAQQQVQGIVGGETVPQQPAQEDISKFQNLMQGNVQGIQQVGDLNLAQQQNRASALARLAEGAGTEQGRRNLLGETFRKQGDYTQGMSGLDQLITSGDKAARESLVTGIGEQAQGLKSQLGDITTQAQQGLASQQQALRSLGGDISGLATGAASGIKSDIQSQLDAELAARGGLSQQISELTSQRQDQLQGLKDFYGNIINPTMEKMKGRASYDYFRDQLGKALGGQEFNIFGEINPEELANINQALQYNPEESSYSPEEFAKQRFKDWMDYIGYGDYASQEGLSQLGQKYGTDVLRDFGIDFQNQYQTRKELGTTSNPVEKALNELGVNQNSLDSMSDLNLNNLASEDQINRYNALKSLLGQSDIILPESRQDYASAEELQSILDRYKL